MSKALLLALAVTAASAASLSADLSAAASDREWKEKPITKVVNLLKDMQAQLDAEGKEDEEMYDKMACWCETNDKEKTKSIADGNQKVEELSAAIEEATASASTLEVDIGALKGESAKLQKALDEAAALREKESAEFNTEQKDMIQSIGSLKGAVRTLGKTQGGSSALQREALLQVKEVLRRQPVAATAAVAPHQRSELRAFMHAPSAERGISLLQEVAGIKAKQPASGAIFGILSQMKESFETNMASAQKEEAQAAEEYAGLKQAKGDELRAADDKAFTKTNELAAAKEKAARSKEDLEDTRAALQADNEFLTNLKGQCANIDNEFEARRKARMEEVKAVGETIGILTDDDAKDQFAKSTFFVQARAQSKRESARREMAATALQSASKRLRSPRLSYLAIRMRIDAFAKVRENIDKMVGQLGEEQKDEVTKKDGCVSDINTNEKQTTESKAHKEDKEVDVADLESDIAAITEEQAKLKQGIADAQVELKKASENREGENKDFQTTVSDQRATQAILKKALDKMAAFYAKKASLVQVHATSHRAGQQPPGNFAPQKKNAGGTGVVALLESIIDESKEVEKDALTAENDAQTAYESFVKDTNGQIAALNSKLTNDSETKAKDKKEEVADEADAKQTGEVIDNLGNMAQTLHGECDFTIDNFGKRQSARSAEMDALKESKAIFSGVQMSLAQTGQLPQ